MRDADRNRDPKDIQNTQATEHEGAQEKATSDKAYDAKVSVVDALESERERLRARRENTQRQTKKLFTP